MQRFTQTVAALLVVVLWGGLAWSAERRQNVGVVVLDPVLEAARARGALRVAVDVGYAPFAVERGGALVGFDVALAERIAARLGLAVELVPTGFDALYDALAADKADMVAAALPYTPEQGHRALFSQPYFDAGLMLVARTGTPIARAEDLAGRQVGVALGSEADTLARSMAHDLGFTLHSSYDEASTVLDVLAAGDLDAAIVDRPTALIAISRGAPLQIVQALSYDPYVLAVAPPAFQLLAEIDATIQELTASGELAALEQQWFR